MKKIYHFTLGPVQSFVAQARRTRDLWAGSFLLSWLAGQALNAVLKQGGKIIFPAVADKDGNAVDPMLMAITGQPENPPPLIGSIPNRFKASVPDDFDPDAVEDAVRSKWNELTDAVWKAFVLPHLEKGQDVEGIWNRQTSGFWEINWVLGDPEPNNADDRWLDMRKNWRNRWPEPEGGDHCTMMADFQELSGFNGAKSNEAAKQKAFWDSVRSSVKGYLDIRQHERLCAIALVKRLFPYLDNLEDIIGWIPGGNPDEIGYWPSTTYMAVAPWLEHIAGDSERIEALDDYVISVVTEVGCDYFKKLAAERATHLAMLEPLRKKRNDTGNCHLDDLDGDLLHVHALANYRTTYLSDQPLTDEGEDNDPDERKKLNTELARLYKSVGKKPRSYYALLLMDGDNLGAMLRENDPEKISRALLSFTNAVLPCVNEDPAHSGVTIYAGGDDVFALLPLDKAVACAQALRQIYSNCFASVGMAATASCAIVFAHHQVPLREVISEAHHQLDDIAKERNGRDSLALAVYKPGGVTAQWVSAWQAPSPVNRFQELVGALMEEEYPRGFFHKLRDRYGLFGDEGRGSAPAGMDVTRLLAAEYMQSRDRMTTRQQAEKAAQRLEAVCKPWVRRDGETGPATHMNMDGGFIARFLTQEED